MIVCICKGISHRQVDDLVQAGARSVRELGRACGAGTDCGCCAADLRARIEALRPRRDDDRPTELPLAAK